MNESLKKCAPLVERIGPREWNFVLNNGSTLLVNARADENWLQLDAPVVVASTHKQSAWQLLGLNKGLGGLSKVATVPDENCLRLRAEIPLDDEVDLHLRIQEVCTGMKSAGGRLHGEGNAKSSSIASIVPRPQEDEGDGRYIRKLCEAVGWKFTERSNAKLAVDLETRAGFHQAIVSQQVNGGVSLSVELTRDEQFAETSKRAIGSLLLRATGLVKLARAVVVEDSDAISATFEAVYQSAPSALEVSHALSALAVGSSLCGPAVEAMRDEVVATSYLELQGLESR